MSVIGLGVACSDDDVGNGPRCPLSGCVGNGGNGGGGPTGDATLSCVAAWGADESQQITTTSTDSEGNIYVSGFFEGSMVIGDALSSDQIDMFVAKMTAECEPIWAFQLEQNRADIKSYATMLVAVGPDDQPVIAGDIEDGPVTVSRDGAIIALNGTEADAFVAKLDADGNLLWSQPMMTQGAAPAARDIAFDDTSNVYVTGDGYGDVGNLITVPTPLHYAYLVKLSPTDGSPLWERIFPHESNTVEGDSVTVDHEGNVIVAGHFTHTITIEGEVLESADQSIDKFDLFIAKLDPDGNMVWAKRFGDPTIQLVFGLAVDGSGNIFAAGTNDGELDLGLDEPLVSGGGSDGYLFKMDPGGTPLWGISLENAQMTELELVTAEAVVFTANIAEQSSIFGEVLEKDGSVNGILGLVYGDGTPGWVRKLGQNADTRLFTVSRHLDGIVVGGMVDGDFETSAGTITPGGMGDALLGALDIVHSAD